ncbi:transient receptor potential cation channel subfamily M member 5-like [Diadema antillarum]|uniref:transient receptor potential cation channel subfamily M member 5-like n=1 Tax=Diadema antillarum TaxID=105358 RepID=UPI003A87A2B0
MATSCCTGSTHKDRGEIYTVDSQQGQSTIVAEGSTSAPVEDVAMETVLQSYTPTPEPPASFLTSKILYRKELDSGLRTGKRWLKTRFALVPTNANPKDVVNFLLEKWRLPKPNLVISVVGGTAKFHMNIKRREVFRLGIAKAAATTGAWVISSGLNRGIVKTLGEALRDHAVAAGARRSRAKVAAIAMTSLRDIEGFQALIDGAQNDRPVVYGIGSEAMAEHRMLDPNYPYALLTTDGNPGSTHPDSGDGPGRLDQPGSEIELRSLVEQEIAMRNITHSNKARVPIVCFLVNGGPHHIRAVHSAITNRIPVLVLAGSYGCADVVAKAYKLGIEDKAMLHDIMTSEFKTVIPADESADLLAQLSDIIRQRHLLNIYELDGVDGSPNIDIDEAFLRALLKGSQGSRQKNQLHMAYAVIWKRVELAQKQLLAQYKWKSSDLSEALRMALVNDQTDFIRLFLNINIKLDKYLHAGELRRLYNEVNENSLLYRLLRKKSGSNYGPIELSAVGAVIKDLTTHAYEPHYLRPDSPPVLSPCRELFLWAVLQDRVETAQLFWEEGKAWMGGALVATRIMRSMHHLETEPQKLADLQDHLRTYEKLALGVLDDCYREDRRRTSLLLIREMPEWGNVSCLCLAAAAHDKYFIAHPAVQNVLNDLWMGRISRQNGLLKTWLATFFPPFALTGIRFVDEEKDRQYSVTLQTKASKSRACGRFNFDEDDDEDASQMNRARRDSIISDSGSVVFNSVPFTPNSPAPNFTLLPLDDIFKHKTVNMDAFVRQEESNRVPLTKRIPLFLSAPAINFRYYVMSHLVFLVLFSYVILCDFHPEPSLSEYVLIGWVCTLIIETLRQMISIGGFFNCRKFFHSWLRNYYYLVDTLTMVLFSAGTVLRHFPGYLEAARIVHSVTLILFYIRLLHIFSVNKHLGPKLIMIMKMINDLLVFICILMVFLLAYGIAVQAVLFPHVTDPAELLKGIFYYSYFQIYGELFLEEIAGDNCSNDDPKMPPCPANSTFGVIILAVYLFISNVMLLNLLIAMLNYTFAQVQENTDVVWKYQRYSLIKDYYNRPVLAPPFIIISHFLIFCSFILRCWCGCCDRFAVSRSLRRKLPGDLIAEITTWEKIRGEHYVTKTSKKKDVGLADRMSSIEQKLSELTQKSTSTSNPDLTSKLKERLDNIEGQMLEMKDLLLKALSAVTKADVTTLGHTAPSPKPVETANADESKRAMRESLDIPKTHTSTSSSPSKSSTDEPGTELDEGESLLDVDAATLS